MEFYIRPIEIGDGKGINELRRMPGVFENILGIPSEQLKRNEDFIANLDANQHQFVAVARSQDGQEVIIGHAGLTVYPNQRMRHSGGIGIMIHKDYQNQGVGSALLGRLVDIADNWLMLVRIELTVFADNARAIHLYERFGFEKEGVKRLAAIRNGKYEDEYLMARINRSNYNSQS
ncbi:Acetyltransferase, GNAT [Desulfitobacterium hafniense]|uniref:Acetyltransferase, GNAT n=1 Tax=Desulfitobacterium hafniense TaxID=49338 RepID=A0A098B5P4_DESHA|nr:GNAT family N-acetyltransferase [Desulfitobacterium hafniense]CDX04208.1 Acetyltransferase, GNAT [Desulfitobacterium hafniense]